jgi:hypothetical protein
VGNITAFGYNATMNAKTKPLTDENANSAREKGETQTT